MQGGRSYARARAEAWKGKIPPLLDSPNDILGVEYTRAVLTLSSGPEILPVRRIGSGYADETMRGKYSSASAIRASLARGEREGLGEALPPYVAQSLNKNIEDHLEALEKYALLTVSAERLRAVADCREGLENALKRAAEENLPSLAQALTSKRYTTSRIRRILCRICWEFPKLLYGRAFPRPSICAFWRQRTGGRTSFPRWAAPIFP